MITLDCFTDSSHKVPNMQELNTPTKHVTSSKPNKNHRRIVSNVLFYGVKFSCFLRCHAALVSQTLFTCTEIDQPWWFWAVCVNHPSNHLAEPISGPIGCLGDRPPFLPRHFIVSVRMAHHFEAHDCAFYVRFRYFSSSI